MISIVTITYNNFEDLVKTQESIKDLPSSLVEKIVINGGACEKTRSYLKEHPEITSISEPDEGISDAFNKGIRLSKGDGIWFLNSGDICIDPNYAQFVDEYIKDYDFIYSDVKINLPNIGLTRSKADPNRSLSSGLMFPHQGMVFNKEVFKKVGSFRAEYKIAMDFDLYCRMINHGLSKKLYYPKFVAQMDGDGISSKEESVRSLRDEIKRSLVTNNLYFGSTRALSIYGEFKYLIRRAFRGLGILNAYLFIKYKLSGRIEI